MDRLVGKLTGIGSLQGTLSGGSVIHGNIVIPESVGGNPYEGEYEFTPTTETQTIEINGLFATNNITINAIPRNYGLVEWNGTGIKIS